MNGRKMNLCVYELNLILSQSIFIQMYNICVVKYHIISLTIFESDKIKHGNSLDKKT